MYMFIADCMSRNAIKHDEGRADHTARGGIWMNEPEGKYLLLCEEMLAIDLQGYYEIVPIKT